MTAVSEGFTEQTVAVAGGAVQVLKGGAGAPLVLLHADTGNPGWTAFCRALAQRHTVYIPSHPGYSGSSVPEWARDVRDLAIIHQWLLRDLGLAGVPLVGFDLGAWIAAEMA